MYYSHSKTNFEYQFPENQFSEDTFQALSPYIDTRHFSINKIPQITKAVLVAKAKWCDLKNQGVEKPKVVIQEANGDQWIDHKGNPVNFNHWKHYKNKFWSPESTSRTNKKQNIIQPCLDGDELHYYMCRAKAGKKLVYGDLDIHNEYQDDLDDAIFALKKLFGDDVFYRHSHRGYNAWLKIADAPAAKEYNAALSWAERVLSDLFAQRKIKTSFEIKGRSAWGEVQSFNDTLTTVAKLPCWNHHYPCNRKDNDDRWNYRRLEEFNNKPDIKWKQFIWLIKLIESKLDPVKVREGKQYLATFKQKPIVVADVDEQPTLLCSPVKTGEMPTPKKVSDISKPPDGEVFPKASPKSLDDIRNITDAWLKDRLFAFNCNRRAKRPLSAEELLSEDRKYHIYNGEWEDGLLNRINRYTAIAPFAARNFDIEKCGNKSQRPLLDANIKHWKSKAHLFAKVAIGYVGKKAIKIDHSTLIALTAMIQTVSKANGDCPRDSIQGWWEELAAEGKLPVWHSDTYTAARSVLLRYRLICIDHLRYQHVPDARGQCKGIWIKQEKEVGERNYDYPDYLSITYSLFSSYNGYNVVTSAKNCSITESNLCNAPP